MRSLDNSWVVLQITGAQNQGSIQKQSRNGESWQTKGEFASRFCMEFGQHRSNQCCGRNMCEWSAVCKNQGEWGFNQRGTGYVLRALGWAPHLFFPLGWVQDIHDRDTSHGNTCTSWILRRLLQWLPHSRYNQIKRSQGWFIWRSFPSPALSSDASVEFISRLTFELD